MVSRKSTFGHVNKDLGSVEDVHNCPLNGGGWSQLGKVWSTLLLNDPWRPFSDEEPSGKS